jgi:AraC-like DNA-binding protein
MGGRAAPCADDLAALPPIDAVALLLRAVERRCRDARPPCEGTALASASRVEDVARLFGVSARRAHARIVHAVGLSPKRALRIQRLHATLRSVGTGESLIAAAMLAGYSDQAHFTRDARALLGEPPSTWFRRGADSFKPGG